MKDQRPKVEPTDVRGLIIRLQDDIMWEAFDLEGEHSKKVSQQYLQKIIDMTAQTRVLAECIVDWVNPTTPCCNILPTDTPSDIPIFCTKPKGHSGWCGCGGTGHNEVMWG